MGLIGGMARTAVVAGTATAVSNRVSRRQAGRWAEQAPPQQYQEPPPQQYQQPPPQQYQQPVAPAPAGTGSDDLIDQLQKLAALRDQGILTDAEFEAQKAKLLAS
jgi:Short C-terminal domain